MGGILGAFTASFFKLDPLGNVPLEPLLDLIPGLSPLRVTLDMVDSESVTYTYTKTNHPVQDFFDITSHVKKNLERVTISGTLGALLPLVPAPIPTFGLAPPPPPVPGSLLRLDLIRIANLKNIADARQPIMVVTPRVGMARGIITMLQPRWGPDDGESSTVSITVEEIRRVSPIIGTPSVDYPAQTSGNNASSGGGQTASKASGGTSTLASGGAGDALAPTHGPGPEPAA